MVSVGEWPDGYAEDIQIRNNGSSKWDVDESGQDYWKIGSEEVQYENLLSNSVLESLISLVIFVAGKARREIGEKAEEQRLNGREDAGWEENLRLELDTAT